MPLGQPRPGFTLIELLMVIAVMGILAGLVLLSTQSSAHDQLVSAIHVMASEVAYGRSLAVAYNSRYRIRFDFAGNHCILEHSGTNPGLDKLPDTPFRSPSDPAGQHIVDLGALPQLGAPVQLLAAVTDGNSPQRVNNVEFGPLGETTRGDATVVWLRAGQGKAARYVWLRISPVTGLAEVGDVTATGPAPTASPVL